MSHADLEHLLDQVIAELKEQPLDLLSIGDRTGEAAYLEHARCSYLRTLRDVVQIADSMASLPRELRILEIGAFLGVVSSVLARLGFCVTAHDIPEFMGNERLLSRYHADGVTTISSNLRSYALPVDTAAFDLVIMCETLEHLNFNPLPVLAELNRALALDGHLYLSLPNQASLVNRVKLLCGRSIHNPIGDFRQQLTRESNMIVGIHWREYTADELQGLVKLSGFSVVSHIFFTTHNASLPARAVYAAFPKLRSNQTLLARKVETIKPEFCFCEATT